MDLRLWTGICPPLSPLSHTPGTPPDRKPRTVPRTRSCPAQGRDRSTTSGGTAAPCPHRTSPFTSVRGGRARTSDLAGSFFSIFSLGGRWHTGSQSQKQRLPRPPRTAKGAKATPKCGGRKQCCRAIQSLKSVGVSTLLKRCECT